MKGEAPPFAGAASCGEDDGTGFRVWSLGIRRIGWSSQREFGFWVQAFSVGIPRNNVAGGPEPHSIQLSNTPKHLHKDQKVYDAIVGRR